MAKGGQTGNWQKKIRSTFGRIKYLSGAPVRWLQAASIRPFSWFQGGPATSIARLQGLYSLSPEIVLAGYVQGSFPTGESNGSIAWHCPDERAVIEPGKVHVSKRLRGYLNKSELSIGFNQSYNEVLLGCADREQTWITSDIIEVYQELHGLGFAHSVEARNGDELVGGGYGVALGKVFFLESMFCRQDQASKIAFVHLARKLEAAGFYAIDCQFLTEHWKRFGAKPWSREKFQSIVTLGLNEPVKFAVPENESLSTNCLESAVR